MSFIATNQQCTVAGSKPATASEPTIPKIYAGLQRTSRLWARLIEKRPWLEQVLQEMLFAAIFLLVVLLVVVRPTPRAATRPPAMHAVTTR